LTIKLLNIATKRQLSKLMLLNGEPFALRFFGFRVRKTDIMKKVISLPLLGLILMAMSSSCVSKKKYVSAQSHIDSLQEDSARYVQKIDNLQEELKETSVEFSQYKMTSESKRAAMMAQLAEQGEALTEKDQALQERAQRLQALQERLNQQQRIVNQLRKTVQDALVNFDQDELSVEVKNGKVYVSLSDKLLFPSGSAKLNSEGKEAIGKVGDVLQNNPKINIDVVGHTDSIPINTARYKNNWDLSVARATTITELLTNDHNIAGSRLTASGMSKYQPVATNETKEGRAKNRRTEIILTPKLEELFKILDGSASASVRE